MPLSLTDRLGAVGGGFAGDKPPPYGLGNFIGIFPIFCRGRRPRRPVPFVVTFSTNRLGAVGGGGGRFLNRPYGW